MLQLFSHLFSPIPYFQPEFPFSRPGNCCWTIVPAGSFSWSFEMAAAQPQSRGIAFRDTDIVFGKV
jgi:hypothetical protein